MRIESIDFRWTPWSFPKSGRGELVFANGDGLRICAIPVGAPFVRYKAITNRLFDASLATQEAAWRLLDAFDDGVRLGLAGDFARLGVSIDRRHPGNQSPVTFMRLAVRVRTDMPQLDLEPLVKILPDEYVRPSSTGDGFVYCGKPLRFSGVNFGWPGSHNESEQVVRRMRRMNINAVRLWAGPLYPPNATNAVPEFLSSGLGSGSQLDNVDYFIWLCQQNGIFINCTTVGAHLPPMPEAYADVGRNAYWLFPEMIRRKNDHARRFLEHVNPYAGRKNAELSVFATFELNNEDGFVIQLTEGCFKRWSAAHQRYLKDRYSEFLAGKYGRPMMREPSDDFRSPDFLEFAIRTQAAVNRDAENVVRSCAAPGRGSAVVPVVQGTHARIHMNTQFVHQLGEVASVGAYQAFSTIDRTEPFYPWKPLFANRPLFYNMMWETVPNKIFTVYEHHPHCPYDYRAEWMPTLTMVAGGLGWDGLYLFTFLPPSFGVGGDFDLACALSPIAMPLGTQIERYNENYRSASDEILMGGLVVCGQAFINGLKPNDGKTIITYGRSAIYDPMYWLFSPNPPNGTGGERISELAERSHEQIKSQAELYRTIGGMFVRLNETALRHELLVGFDESQPDPIRVRGELLEAPTADELRNPPRIAPNDEIVWDAPARRAMLDAVHSKLAVGVLPSELRFRDGVSFVQPRPLRFAFFGLSTRDAKPVAESRDILVNVSSEAYNFGYKFNSERFSGGHVLQHVAAIENPGTAPVEVVRPSGTVKVPGPPFTLCRYDFAGFLYSEECVTGGSFVIRREEPLFIARLTRPPSEN